MGDRINGLIIRTKDKSEQNRDVLYTLRSVLHVAEAWFGYVVTFNEPMKPEHAAPSILACKWFDFVEDANDVETIPYAFEHVSSFLDAKVKVIDTLVEHSPKIELYGSDHARFAADMRAWRKMYDLVNDALDPSEKD